MSETPETIAQQLAELEASLSQPLPEAVRRLVEQQLATLRHRRTAMVDLRGAQVGDVAVGNIAEGEAVLAVTEVRSTFTIVAALPKEISDGHSPLTRGRAGQRRPARRPAS